MNGTIAGFAISTVVGIGLFAFLRLIPKEKAINAGDKHGEFLGTLVSNWGNGKLGKKIWSKIEEGPVVTAISYLMSFFVSFGKNLVKDNYTKED